MDVEKKPTQEAEFKRIKENVRTAYEYFKDNYDRYHEFRKFVFDTTITPNDEAVLNALQKPVVEFNTLEAYLSRISGEFVANDPDIVVSPQDNAEVDSRTIEVVEGHIRHILFDAKKNGFSGERLKECMSGGFSGGRVCTDYPTPFSFNQIIEVEGVYDPTLCVFDPLARDPHKGDGSFCAELYPKRLNELKDEYPDIDISEIKFSRSIEGFNWSYENEKEKILLLCDYYEKKKEKEKIVELVTGHVMTYKAYKDFIKKWELDNFVIPAPAIRRKRESTVEVIYRYVFIENKILEGPVKTDYTSLPIVFFDGNSVVLRKGTSNSFYQMTRPLIFHAKGVQKLKNCAGQNLANELEMLVQHKFMFAKESLPDEQDYLNAILNPQLAQTLIYKAYKDNDPNVPVPPPREIVRPPIPSEIANTFMLADKTTQAILGLYDAVLGINDKNVSGKAIIEGASQSNSAAMPYIIGFLAGLTQIANLIIELIPKYYKTPRTIPIVKPDGTRDYVLINDKNNPNSIDLNYDSNALRVKVEAGPSFASQKSKGLSQIIQLANASPIFGKFLNEKGLKIILDNLEIRGIDELKELAEPFMIEMQQMQQQQQQMQQMAIQNNPAMLRAQNERIQIQLDAIQNMIENKLKAAEISLEKQSIDNDTIRVMSDLQMNDIDTAVAMEKVDAEKSRAAVDMAIKTLDMKHRHDKEKAEFHHKVMKKQSDNSNLQEQ